MKATEVYSETVRMPVSERAKLFNLIATQGFNESNYAYAGIFQELPETLSLKDAAEYLGVTDITVRRWIKDGKLAPSRIGRNYLFSVVDLRAFKEVGMIGPVSTAPHIGSNA